MGYKHLVTGARVVKVRSGFAWTRCNEKLQRVPCAGREDNEPSEIKP